MVNGRLDGNVSTDCSYESFGIWTGVLRVAMKFFFQKDIEWFASTQTA